MGTLLLLFFAAVLAIMDLLLLAKVAQRINDKQMGMAALDFSVVISLSILVISLIHGAFF
jgi:hypothetical protein